jgi:hypothetical protein
MEPPHKDSSDISKEYIRKLKLNQSGDYITALFYLMKELHISYCELMDMPLSAINMLLHELKNHQKREEKASKKGNKR